MSFKFSNAVIAVTTAILVLIPINSANAQRNHGGGGGGGGRPVQQQQRIEVQRPQQRVERVQFQRQQPRFERPQIQQRPQIMQRAQIPQRQPRFERPQMQRQNPVWQNRGWPTASRQRVERQPPMMWPQINRVEHGRQNIARRNEFPRVDQRQMRVDSGQANAGMRRERIDRSINDNSRGQRPPAWSHAWPNNRGFERSSEVHARNAESRDLRFADTNLVGDQRQSRAESRWFAQRIGASNTFAQNTWSAEQQEWWRENALRSVVFNVAASNAAYNPNYYAFYDPYYFADPFDPFYVSSVYYGDYAPFVPPYSVFSAGFSFDSGGFAFFSDVYDNGLPYVTYVDPYAGYLCARQSDDQLVAYGYSHL